MNKFKLFLLTVLIAFTACANNSKTSSNPQQEVDNEKFYFSVRISELSKEGRWDEAFAMVDSLCEGDKDKPSYSLYKAFIHLAKGDKETAIPFFEKAADGCDKCIAEGATDHTIYYNRALAECYLGREGAYEKLLENKQYFYNDLNYFGEHTDELIDHFFNLIKDFDEETVLQEIFLNDTWTTGEYSK